MFRYKLSFVGLAGSKVKSCTAKMVMAGAAHIEFHIQLLLGKARWLCPLFAIQSMDLTVCCSLSCLVADPNQTVMGEQRTDWMIAE